MGKKNEPTPKQTPSKPAPKTQQPSPKREHFEKGQGSGIRPRTGGNPPPKK